MPFYEYQCKNCGHRLEVLQKISVEPLIYCPECNEAALKKLISAAAFRLKGTGWYETDFKNSDKKSAKPDTKKSESSKSGESPDKSKKSDKNSGSNKSDSSKSSAPVNSSKDSTSSPTP